MTGVPYPISEKAPEQIRSATGKPMTELTLENVLDRKADQRDFAITEQSLLLQAEVARSSQRHSLAENLERASEMVAIPDALLLDTYELLRPGRAESAHVLLARAALFREQFAAERMAAFLEEAAQAYERRSLFRRRY
jgi:propanediol dehydratase small subunit